MRIDSIDAYEKHAKTFLQRRDKSEIGVKTVTRWATSLKPMAEVLELACGGGKPVTQALIESGLKVWAVDSSVTLTAEFKERFPAVPIDCNSVLQSNCFNRKYNAAISIGLIFLLNETDQIKMLDRVFELLLPESSFLFTAPIEVGTWIDVNTGHSCLSLGQKAYQTALKKSGFQVIDHYEDSGKNNYYESKKPS